MMKWAGGIILVAVSMAPVVLLLFEEGWGVVIGIILLPFAGWILASLGLILIVAPVAILCAPLLHGCKETKWRFKNIVTLPIASPTAVSMAGTLLAIALLIMEYQWHK